MNKTTRGFLAGKQLARSIREMVNLMYQNNTALSFLEGLLHSLITHTETRKAEKEDRPARLTHQIWPWRKG